MAYNYMFPANYQQYQAQPQHTNLIWVSGEAGAKSYMVVPNTTVPLWDSEAQVIYLKSADALGRPTMKTIDYTIRDDSRFETLTASQSDFATKVEVDNIKKDIVALRERVGLLTEKEGEGNE